MLHTNDNFSHPNIFFSNHFIILSCYRVIGVERDGNCFYKCLSQHIQDTQMDHDILRRDLVHYISCNMDKYRHLVDGNISDHLRQQSFTDGSSLQQRTGTTWRFWFRETDSNDWIRFSGNGEDGCYPNSTIRLLLENSHFSLVNAEHQKPDKNPAQKTLSPPGSDWFELTGQE